MEVVPVSVGEASRRWDEQHLDLAAAAEQITGAPASGFTAGVRGAASRFTSAWHGHAAALGSSCEETADGLRAALRDYVTTDESVADDFSALLVYAPYLQERR